MDFRLVAVVGLAAMLAAEPAAVLYGNGPVNAGSVNGAGQPAEAGPTGFAIAAPSFTVSAAQMGLSRSRGAAKTVRAAL